MFRRWLAGQFARPSGRLGRLLIAPWLDRLSPRMNAAALAQLGVVPGKCVLEAGFGGGALLEALLDAGAEVIGVEPSRAMLARAHKRFR
ncbi:MAG: class I SAM-dependent methyltransferase, partial [Pseudomonadota bacterium]|nr:class I SAM-dependent methyltransferase [Pseudomonadota bacterium]